MIQKTIHIVLAALILLSSSGLIINKHFCLDQLVSVAIMTSAEKCHTPAAEEPKPEDSREKVEQKDCCTDTSAFLKVTQEQKAENTQISLFELTDIHALALIQEPLPASVTDVSLYANRYYNPPLIVWDRSVHLQTFLC